MKPISKSDSKPQYPKTVMLSLPEAPLPPVRAVVDEPVWTGKMLSGSLLPVEVTVFAIHPCGDGWVARVRDADNVCKWFPLRHEEHYALMRRALVRKLQAEAAVMFGQPVPTPHYDPDEVVQLHSGSAEGGDLQTVCTQFAMVLPNGERSYSLDQVLRLWGRRGLYFITRSDEDGHVVRAYHRTGQLLATGVSEISLYEAIQRATRELVGERVEPGVM